MENTTKQTVKTGDENPVNRTSTKTIREINDAVESVEPKDGTTYGEMTVANYNSVIETREHFAESCETSEWEKKDMDKEIREIAKQEECIAAKKAAYEADVKRNKDWMKESKKNLRQANKKIAKRKEQAESFRRTAEMYRDMRDKKSQEITKD